MQQSYIKQVKRLFIIILAACSNKDTPPPQPATDAPVAAATTGPTGDATNASRDGDLPGGVSAECRAGSNALALQAVPFNLDDAALSAPAQRVLDKNAKCLAQAPRVKVVVEGHCDERGTTEYNLSLGEQRASSVVKYLQRAGIDPGRMRPVSKGKNEPICTESSEACWAKNRRVELEQ